MAFIAFLIVVLFVDSGRSGALLHMKFGPGDAADGNVRHGRLVGGVPYLQRALLVRTAGLANPICSLWPTASAATAAGAVRCRSDGIGVGDRMGPDWLPLVLMALPPLVVETLKELVVRPVDRT